MSRSRTYLDHNATSPLRPEVASTVVAAFALGNPSSVHAEGRAGRAALERARTEVASLVGAEPDAVVFTSGGTEANAAVLRPTALLTPDGRPVTRLVTSPTEHASVLSGHGFQDERVVTVPVDGAGRIDLEVLASVLAGGGEPTLLSVQAGNSETGVLQPLAEVASLARRYDAALHVDAVQAAGRLSLAMAELGADALTLSGHKLGAPMGAGALVLPPSRRGPAAPARVGGGQERGWRGGTEALPAIVGFGAAAMAASRGLAVEADRLAALRDTAEAWVLALAPDAVVFGAGAERLPNTLAFAMPGLKAETALIGLDLAGIAVSSGSACASGKIGRSHVLAAMGVPAPLAAGAIRLSFGWSSTAADVKAFATAFETVLQCLYQARAA